MRYLIYFQPRCGSTYIASRLNSQDGGCFNGMEIISRQVAWDLGLVNDDEFDNYTPFVKKMVLDRFYFKFEQYPIVGCKVAPYQIVDDVPGFFQYSLTACDKLIFLYRENPVQTAISQLWSLARSRQKREAWLIAGEVDTIGTFEIQRGDLEWYIIDSIVQRELVLSLSSLVPKKLSFSYEQFFANPEKSFDSIRDYLEVGGVATTISDLVKVRDRPTREYIRNYSEVRRWVQEMGFDSSLLDTDI